MLKKKKNIVISFRKRPADSCRQKNNLYSKIKKALTKRDHLKLGVSNSVNYTVSNLIHTYNKRK